MLGVGEKVAALVLRTNQIKMLKLSKSKKLTLKLEDQENETLFLRANAEIPFWLARMKSAKFFHSLEFL